jgi:RNA polymerase sigma-70 factor (ECF subfamily)
MRAPFMQNASLSHREALMGESDAKLVEQAQAGDRPALEELVRRTARLVYARLFLETGERELAEDLAQETWLRAYRSLGELKEPATFRSWLLAIAQNVAADQARRSACQKRAAPPRVSAEVLASVPGRSPLPEDEAARAELRQHVLAIIRSLPEEYRLPLMLRYLAGADYGTMAMQLGVSNGSLRGLLHRGLKLLRARLSPSHHDPAPASDTHTPQR